MIFNVVNNGRGPRIVRTSGRRAIVVHPGEKNAQDLDLDVETARHLASMAKLTAKNAVSLIITAKDEAGRKVLGDTPQNGKDRRIPGTGELVVRDAVELADAPGEGEQSPYLEAPINAPAALLGPRAALVERADTLNMDELRVAVRETLGDESPRELDRLKRTQIMRLLRTP